MLFLKDLKELGVYAAEFRWDAEMRKEIRQAIIKKLKIYLPADLEALEDLSAPPRLHNYSVSITHTHDLGGFVAVERPDQIGVDVELQARVRPELVKRISTPEEFQDAPKPELLWCAKEALYKALEDEQPQVVTELTIAEWRENKNGLWEFKGYGARNAKGIARAEEGHLFAAALIVSN